MTGDIRLGSFSATPTRGDLVECRATLAVDEKMLSLTATATGPVGAMTSMLYDIGAPVQILRLQQLPADHGETTTLMLCEHNGREFWARGTGPTGDEANVQALIAGANGLRAAA